MTLALSTRRRKRSSLLRTASSARLRSVMSRMKALKLRRSPVRSGVIAISAGKRPPSRRNADTSTRRLSMPLSPVSRNRFMPRMWAWRYSAGMIVSATWRPSASSRGQPKICSACAFQSMMRPPSSMVTTASSAASTMSRVRSSCASRSSWIMWFMERASSPSSSERWIVAMRESSPRPARSATARNSSSGAST